MSPPRTLPLLAALVAAAAACDSAGPAAAPCLPGSDRIVVGECLLGLTVDSDSADVVARLGAPDRYGTDNEGFGLRFLYYVDHPVGGATIVTLAPRGLFAVSVSRGFTAVTDEGIGAGTPRAEVRRRFGRPVATDPGALGFDWYAFPADSVSFQISYALFEDGPGVGGITLQSSKRIF